MNIDLSTKLGNIHLDNCLMNASGVSCTDDSELNQLIKSDLGAIVTKSCTLEKREGNPTPRYYDMPYGSINAMGLPNNGINYYLDFINNSQLEKPIILSIAGLTLYENIDLIKIANEYEKVKAIEINLSCPNVVNKPQVGYDFATSDHYLEEFFSVTRKPIGVKLPPYFDVSHFKMMAAILSKYPISHICCINSIGNGLYIEDETVVLKPKSGFGGIGGTYVKPTALANVRMFSTLLDNVDIIGCGGVKTGRDVFEHILCGASVVQIGTTLYQEGVMSIERIKNELIEIMIEKGYNNINEFKGKLKEI